MANPLRELDDLLRGNSTRPELLAEGTDHLRLDRHLAFCLVLGLVYGVSMGLYSVLSRTPPVYGQLLASALKVPALFVLTLLVVFPSLYVFLALLDMQLELLSALRLVGAAITVTLAVLGSFAPITAFFTLSTTSYPFMKLLNVLLFAVAGIIGLGFLTRALNQWAAGREPPEEPGEDEPETARARLEERDRRKRVAAGERHLFQMWMLLYAFVGAQMAWLLRPMVGDPALPFAIFRARTGNAFADFFETLGKLFGTQ